MRPSAARSAIVSTSSTGLIASSMRPSAQATGRSRPGARSATGEPRQLARRIDVAKGRRLVELHARPRDGRVPEADTRLAGGQELRDARGEATMRQEEHRLVAA